MSCSSSSPSPLGPSSSRRRVTPSTVTASAHQHGATSSCINVAPMPQNPSRPSATTSEAPVSSACSTSCKCACANASLDSKCPYMRRVAQARLSAADKATSSESSNQCTALVPATSRSRLTAPVKQPTTSSSPSSPSASSTAPLVRGEEYSLYRLSKSAALQAASRGIQLTLVAPNSKFPSTPSSHSLQHDDDSDAATNTTATTSTKATTTTTTTSKAATATTAPKRTTTSAAAAATAAGSSPPLATISTTITTRVRTYDSETGQPTAHVVVSTTKRAILRSAL